MTLHRWFLLIAGTSGLALVAIVPVGKPPDEIAHLSRIWSVGHGKLVADVHADGTGGAILPACIETYELLTLPSYVSVEPLAITKVWRVNSRCRGVARRGHFVEFGNTAINSPVTYAPQAAAVGLLDAVGATSARTFVVGARVAALFAYLGLCWAALRVAPAGRRVLFVVVALPAAVGLASTLSSDTMVLGLSVLAVALLLRVRQAPVCSTADRAATRIALAVTLIALALTKNANAPFLLLWFAVPVRDRSALRRWANRLSVPATGLLLGGLWALQIRGISKFPPARLIPDVDPQRQLSWMLQHPLAFLGVLWRSLASTEFFGGILPRVLGRYPSGRPSASGGWHSPPVPWWMLGLIIVAMVVAVIADAGPKREQRSRRVMAAAGAVAVLSFVLVWLLVYAVSSPVGGPRVLLVQGRYFTPLLPLLALVLVETRCSRPAGDVIARRTDAALAATMSIVLVGEVINSYTMYYR